MDWLIRVTNRLKVNRKEMKRAGKSEEGRKGCGGSFRVKNWANSHVWETEDKEKGLLRHQFQTNNMNTVSTNYDYWNRRLIVLLVPWFRVWFGFVNALPSLYILFFYYAKSTLSNHTSLHNILFPISPHLIVLPIRPILMSLSSFWLSKIIL